MAGKTVLNADDIFEEIRYVRLETNKQSLLRDIPDTKRIIMTNDRFYIYEYYNIIIFNSQGNLVRTINHRGQGSEEYIMIIDFTLGKNGELAINDGNRRRILFYTDDDRFILTYPYPNDLEPRNIEYLNDSLLVLQSDVSGKNEFDLINPNSNILLNSYSPIKPAYISAASHGRYVRYNGKLLWHEPLNNNICELTADSAKIRYTIDVDGRTPPQDFWLKDTARKEKKEWTELIREHRQKGYIDNIMFFSETDETILLRFSGQNDTFDGTYALVDKETRQSTVIDMINFDGSFLWNPKQMYAQADGWIIIPIPPDLLLQEPQGDIAKQFPGLQPDDNPILCVAKLR